jgi:hypothetical protein
VNILLAGRTFTADTQFSSYPFDLSSDQREPTGAKETFTGRIVGTFYGDELRAKLQTEGGPQGTNGLIAKSLRNCLYRRIRSV